MPNPTATAPNPDADHSHTGTGPIRLEPVPEMAACTSFANSVKTFPGGQYSHTTNQPGVSPRPSHCSAAHPTLVVSFQTSCVKWPVCSVKLGLSKS